MLASAAKDEDGHPQQEEDIRAIEHPREQACPTSGPFPAEGEVPSGHHVQEVANRTKDDPVVEIADAPGQDQSDSDVSPVRSSEGPECEYQAGNDHRDDREDDEDRSTFLPDPKDRTVIEHQIEIQEAIGQNLDTLVPGWLPVRIRKYFIPIKQDR